MRKNETVFFLGMTIAYFILFVIQLLNENLLSVYVYFFISWTSVSLALLELFKTTAFYLVRNIRLINYLNNKLGNKTSDRKDVVVIKLVSIITQIEYIMILIWAILTPIKKIPNSIAVNKQINCLSVLAFALLFLNLYLSQLGENSYDNFRRKLKK